MSFLAYYHTSLRWALRNLSPTEFKTYTYMISIPIRAKKSEVKGYRNGMEVYNLFRKGRLLPVNVSVRRIAEECNLGERTVAYAIKVLDDRGVIIRITHHKGRLNHVYLVGIENMWTTTKEFKPDCYFTDFTFIQEGERMPDGVRDFILSNRYDAEALSRNEIPGIKKSLGDLFAGPRRKSKKSDEVDLWQEK